MKKYDPMDFFEARNKLWEAQNNDNEHNQEIDPGANPQEPADPNMAPGGNPHPGMGTSEENETPNQSNEKLANISSPFSSLTGKTIEGISVKKTGANAAELKINIQGYGPVSIAWVNNNITFTDAKTGRVVKI